MISPIDTVAAVLAVALYLIMLASFLHIAFESWRGGERDGGIVLGISMSLLLLIVGCFVLEGILS